MTVILKKSLLCTLAMLCCFWAMAGSSAEINVAGLRQIVQAGGSLILDLDNGQFTVTELVMLASSLKYNSTLTIKTGNRNRLTTSQCAQIAAANPGHVVFWF